jgi:biopolymer transport protein ExbD
MRRFSQKNALVTLADINVTPLLDLAFVLLIIFVITTPLLEQSIALDLPRGGRPESVPLDRRDIKTVDVLGPDRYGIDGQTLTLEQIEQYLAGHHEQNPRLVVRVRADQSQTWGAVAGLLDRCERRGITRIRPAMLPDR